MKFSTVLFASAAAAYNTTVIKTITSCSAAGPCETITLTSTYCPENATTVAPFVGAAAGHANMYAAGAAALAAGAMLL